MAEADRNRAADAAFQEEIKKTAAAIIEKETVRIEKSDRAERPKRFISPMTVGGWLLLLSALGFVFSMPNLGGVLLVCGIVTIIWAAIPRSSKPSRAARQNIRSYKSILQNSIYKLSKSFRR